MKTRIVSDKIFLKNLLVQNKKGDKLIFILTGFNTLLLMLIENKKIEKNNQANK
ncbi:MAG: hypothetical protein LBC17_00265 [Lactobacillaceae bacterium]|jgi:hypothetical protein|nr:hypothetical protein [Lactobacillaceae bacterium]